MQEEVLLFMVQQRHQMRSFVGKLSGILAAMIAADPVISKMTSLQVTYSPHFHVGLPL